jgi:hypothetical protein
MRRNISRGSKFKILFFKGSKFYAMFIIGLQVLWHFYYEDPSLLRVFKKVQSFMAFLSRGSNVYLPFNFPFDLANILLKCAQILFSLGATFVFCGCKIILKVYKEILYESRSRNSKVGIVFEWIFLICQTQSFGYKKKMYFIFA